MLTHYGQLKVDGPATYDGRTVTVTHMESVAGGVAVWVREMPGHNGLMAYSTAACNLKSIPDTGYHFEIYTKNPETGEGGWDIQTGFVFGMDENIVKAEERIKEYFGDAFDTIIQLHHCCVNEGDTEGQVSIYIK